GGWLWAIPVVTFGLGVWQIQRLQWKNSLIQQAQDRIYPHDNTPIPFLTSAQVPSIVPVDAQFTRMLATGTFLHDQEILVGPRSLNMAFVSTSDGGGASAGNGGLIGGSAKIGYTVVTPFRLEDGTTILVNRGWIPREMASDRRRREPQGTVTIEGILRDGEPKNYIQMLTIPNKPEKNQWHAIHLDQMSSWAKTSPVILQMTDESQLNALFEGAGQPVLAHPNANFRNQHLEYAITWFSLCAASSLLLVRSNRGLR
ncbi:SURF1 family-domain-containing protein, partial [Entophlyctis helioformis]